MPGIGWESSGDMARKFSPRHMGRSTMKNVRRLQGDRVLELMESWAIDAASKAVPNGPLVPAPTSAGGRACAHKRLPLERIALLFLLSGYGFLKAFAGTEACNLRRGDAHLFSRAGVPSFSFCAPGHGE